MGNRNAAVRPPLPLGEVGAKRRVRGYGLTRDRNPSPHPSPNGRGSAPSLLQLPHSIPIRTDRILARPCGSGSSVLPLPVQDGDQREQPAGGFEIDPHLALQSLLQRARTFIVNAAAAHVDGLDLVGRGGADRLIVAVAD